MALKRGRYQVRVREQQRGRGQDRGLHSLEQQLGTPWLSVRPGMQTRHWRAVGDEQIEGSARRYDGELCLDTLIQISESQFKGWLFFRGTRRRNRKLPSRAWLAGSGACLWTGARLGGVGKPWRVVVGGSSNLAPEEASTRWG
jgi:hypothetical protein